MILVPFWPAVGAILLLTARWCGNRSDGRVVGRASAGLSLVSLLLAELGLGKAGTVLPIRLLDWTALPIGTADAFPIALQFDSLARWCLWPLGGVGLIDMLRRSATDDSSQETGCDDGPSRARVTCTLFLLASLQVAVLADSWGLLLAALIVSSFALRRRISIEPVLSKMRTASGYPKPMFLADLLLLLAAGLMWGARSRLGIHLWQIAPPGGDISEPMVSIVSLILMALMMAGLLRTGLFSLTKAGSQPDPCWPVIALSLGTVILLKGAPLGLAFGVSVDVLSGMALLLSLLMAFFAVTAESRSEFLRLFTSGWLGLGSVMLLSDPLTARPPLLGMLAMAILIPCTLPAESERPSAAGLPHLNRLLSLRNMIRARGAEVFLKDSNIWARLPGSIATVLLVLGCCGLNEYGQAVERLARENRSSPLLTQAWQGGGLLTHALLVFAWLRDGWKSSTDGEAASPNPSRPLVLLLQCSAWLVLAGSCLLGVVPGGGMVRWFGPFTLSGLLAALLAWLWYRDNSRWGARVGPRLDSLIRLSRRRLYIDALVDPLTSAARTGIRRLAQFDTWFLDSELREARLVVRHLAEEGFTGVWTGGIWLSTLLVVLAAGAVWLLFSDLAPVY